jgi:peptidoglycan/xylan/chitin deacetylase (PgdA/CDA1 family)
VLRVVAVAAVMVAATATAAGATPPPDTTAPPTTTPPTTVPPTTVPPTTTPQPPLDDWRDGRVAGCRPGQSFSRVDTRGVKLVAFTFDDGPDRQWTEPILQAFEQRGARATFFVVGSMIYNVPDLVRSMIDRGFEIGNHTMTHSYLPGTIAAEIPRLNSLLQRRFAVRTPFFRSPGLTPGRSISSAAARAGMCLVGTNILSGDDRSPRRSPARLCDTVTRGLRPGSIVLLHDGGNHRQTAEAVPCMLDAAIARGYRIVTLAELLAAGPTVRW